MNQFMNKFIQNKRRNYMELQHPFGGLDKKTTQMAKPGLPNLQELLILFPQNCDR